MQFPEHLKEENNLEKEKKSTKLEVIVFNVLYAARGQNEDKKKTNHQIRASAMEMSQLKSECMRMWE